MDGSVTATGELVFNEIMPHPLASCTERDGEWIEFYNRSGHWVNLSGWSVENGRGEKVVLPTYLLPPDGYFVLGACGDPTLNGGLEADFVYDGFRLDDTGRLRLYDSDMNVVDAFEYDSGWPVEAGSSCERINPGWISTLPSTWGSAIYHFGSGDNGTPGDVNSVYENSFAQNSWAFIKAFVQ